MVNAGSEVSEKEYNNSGFLKKNWFFLMVSLRKKGVLKGKENHWIGGNVEYCSILIW